MGKQSQLKLTIYGYKISNWPRRHVPDIKQNYKSPQNKAGAHTHTHTPHMVNKQSAIS